MANVREKLVPLIGKTIVFTSAIDAWEMYAEEGMKAVVVKFSSINDDDIHKIYVDFAPFEESNHKRQNANYYDGNGVPCLTAVEAGFYKPQDWLYLDDDPTTWPFEVIE